MQLHPIIGGMDPSQRILVTGALGVNGVWVLRSLVARGAEVLATGRRERFDLAPELAGEVPFRPLDVTDPEGIERAFREFRPTTVVHLAALMPGACQEEVGAAFHVNLTGTVNLLEAARRHEVPRFVYASSKSVYGAVTGPYGHPRYMPMPEDGPCRPVLAYDHTKLAGEGAGMNYSRAYGIEFAAIRFGSIYGPGKLERHGPMSLASRIVEDGLAGKPVRIAQGGDQRDDYVYVSDAGEAVAALAVHPRPLRHPVYNVGAGWPASLRDLAAAVRRVQPNADIEIGPGLDPLGLGVPYYVVLDSSRIERELGFVPRFDFDAGVADYARLEPRAVLAR
jgi:UDP-glucose 4-epimerase